jgi:UDP-glucose 4-epimerase
MRILVTGGLGFLGGRIAQYLEFQGYDVKITTRLSGISIPKLVSSNVISIAWDNQDSLNKACKNVDVVIHCAGMNASESFADPENALKINGLATAALTKAAIANHVKKIFYFSTAHVYNNPLRGVISESNCAVNPHPYATSHRAGEDVILNAGYNNRIESVVFRLSNAFGRPIYKEVNCWMLLVNDLCRQVVEKGCLTLHSSGAQERDFIPISDVVSTVGHFIQNDLVGLFNLGSGNSKTVLDMTKLIATRSEFIFGFKPEIIITSENDLAKIDSLHFKIDKLLSNGVEIKDNKVSELDDLLIFCENNYKLLN